MADHILPFHPKENLLKFPTLPGERKNLELHRMLDKLVDIGQENMVYVHFKSWLDYFTRPAAQPEVKADPKPEEKPSKQIELTPEEEELARNPRAYLPKVSGLIEPGLYQKLVNVLWYLDSKHAEPYSCQTARLDELRLQHHTGTIEASDRRSGIMRFYICSKQLEDDKWPPEHHLAWHSTCTSYRNVNRLVEGKVKPEYIQEAVQEIEAELAFLPKLGGKHLRPEMRGKDRLAVIRFREWMAKQKQQASK